jgi:hypothetical protein
MKKGSSTALLAILAILAVFGSLVAYRLRQTKSLVSDAIIQRDEVKREFEVFRGSILNKDYQAAFQLMGPEFQKEWTLEEYKSVFDRLERQHGGLRAIEEIDIAGSLNGARSDWKINVLSRFDYSNGSVKVLHEFHREKNGWKMYSFQPNWSPQ